VLELATGSGNLSKVLPADNSYFGIDISEGLLKIAQRKYLESGYRDFKLFLCSVDNLIFKNNCFDVCICNLSLNFFSDLQNVICEIKRVLVSEGVFMFCVPVPERNKNSRIVRGNLFTEKELKDIFEENSFSFVPCDFKNGTLLYFKAIAK